MNMNTYGKDMYGEVCNQWAGLEYCPVRPTGQKERGAATLVATLILVVIASLGALAVGKAAYTEQKLSGIDLRSKEVYAAAVGGLEYGKKELQRVYADTSSLELAWTNTAAGAYAAAGETAPPLAVFTAAGGGGDIVEGADNYTPAITYTLITAEDADPAIIEIAATATAVGDTHVTKRVVVRMLVSTLGSASTPTAPPLLVENCIPAGSITGTPDIYSGSVAIGTINGTESCIDTGHFDLVNGGSIGTPLEQGATELFSSLFGGLTEEQFKELAALNPAKFMYVDASYNGSAQETSANSHWGVGGQGVWNGNAWHGDVGSSGSNDQVVLYFDSSAGCPPINGSTTVYGLVYYETEDCDNPGGGGGVIYGTMAFEGNLEQFNANTELHGYDLFNPPPGTPGTSSITFLPGSWKDF